MRFLYNKPAILIGDALVVADLHIGMENELARRGIRVGNLSDKILSSIRELAKETNKKRLIILGDAKHEIAHVDEKTISFFEQLTKDLRVEVVKGNHDGGIEKIKGITVHPPEGIVLKNIGLCHGHAWPGEKLLTADYIVTAHQHGQIEIVDGKGKRHREHVWASIPLDEKNALRHYKRVNKKIRMILLPPFNKLLSGAVLNDKKTEMLGPVFSNNLFKLEGAIMYRLDGTCLGTIRSLVKDSGFR
jgi:hypothetical protein